MEEKEFNPLDVVLQYNQLSTALMEKLSYGDTVSNDELATLMISATNAMMAVIQTTGIQVQNCVYRSTARLP